MILHCFVRDYGEHVTHRQCYTRPRSMRHRLSVRSATYDDE